MPGAGLHEKREQFPALTALILDYNKNRARPQRKARSAKAVRRPQDLRLRGAEFRAASSESDLRLQEHGARNGLASKSQRCTTATIGEIQRRMRHRTSTCITSLVRGVLSLSSSGTLSRPP